MAGRKSSKERKKTERKETELINANMRNHKSTDNRHNFEFAKQKLNEQKNVKTKADEDGMTVMGAN